MMVLNSFDLTLPDPVAARRFAEIDAEHLAEELDDMGANRERERERETGPASSPGYRVSAVIFTIA